MSAKFGGARSTVVVPMLKENELVGAFAIYRQEVRLFSTTQVELLTNFAAQAVIAIKNARLPTSCAFLRSAADCYRRRAQGHQPLDLRSTGGAGYAVEGSRPAVRGGYRSYRLPAGSAFSVCRQFSIAQEFVEFATTTAIAGGRGRSRAGLAGGPRDLYSRSFFGLGETFWKGAKNSQIRSGLGVRLCGKARRSA